MPTRNRARRTSPLYLPSAFDLFKPSRDLVVANIHIFGWFFLLQIFFWLHSWIWIPASSGHYWSRFTDTNYSWTLPVSYSVAFIGFSIIWLVIVIGLGTIVKIMSQQAQLEIMAGKSPLMSELWQIAKAKWLKMLQLYIALILITVFSLFTLTARYFMAPYIMLEKDCTTAEALRDSAKLTRRRPGSVWGVIGVLALFGLVGIVPVAGSLAAFILSSLYLMAPALRYQQLKKLS